jgi:hypothetical protein
MENVKRHIQGKLRHTRWRLRERSDNALPRRFCGREWGSDDRAGNIFVLGWPVGQ